MTAVLPVPHPLLKKNSATVLPWQLPFPVSIVSHPAGYAFSLA